MRFGMFLWAFGWTKETNYLIPAWRVIPRNYLLFACHATNATAQLVQETRFVNYWYMGGKEKRDAEKGPVTKAIEAARDEAKKVSDAK